MKKIDVKDLRYLMLMKTLILLISPYINISTILVYLKYFNKLTECKFLEVTPNDIKKEIKSLDSSKKGTFKNIAPKYLNKEQKTLNYPYTGLKTII